eukprot:2970473-Prymnesium_polylepis.4
MPRCDSTTAPAVWNTLVLASSAAATPVRQPASLSSPINRLNLAGSTSPFSSAQAFSGGQRRSWKECIDVGGAAPPYISVWWVSRAKGVEAAMWSCRARNGSGSVALMSHPQPAHNCRLWRRTRRSQKPWRSTGMSPTKVRECVVGSCVAGVGWTAGRASASRRVAWAR